MFLLLSTIPLFDFLLIKLFGKKARWFQLHAIINIIICFLIGQQTIELICTPKLPLNNHNENNIISLEMVIALHIYHYFIDDLSFIEWCHHICFVAFGVLPVLFLYNNIISSVFLFAGCGFPGAIEYTMLTMVKHNKITSLKQKKINSLINNYIRFPISIYGISLAHINNCNNGICKVLDYYIQFLVFVNGTFFNKMAIENYIFHNYNNFYNKNI